MLLLQNYIAGIVSQILIPLMIVLLLPVGIVKKSLYL